MNRIPRDKLIPNEKIRKGKRIGNGQFGEVYKGKAIVYDFSMFKALCPVTHIYLMTSVIIYW